MYKDMTDGELMIYIGKGKETAGWAIRELERRRDHRIKAMER